MPETKDAGKLSVSHDGLERRATIGGSSRNQVVNENVVKRMSMKPAESFADFTMHITEAGEEVRTTSRIIKGFPSRLAAIPNLRDYRSPCSSCR